MQIHVSAEMRALLNQAAALRGQELSEFILQSACQRAEEALRELGIAFLESDTFDAFLTRLDAPAKIDEQLVDLMRRQAPWDT